MDQKFDIGIVGGGLAGLSLAILQSKQGKSIVLFEKNQYPFHRVCGEYISLESWSFLESLGLPLSEMNLPIIKKLLVSSPSGRTVESNLDLGGFGISRYLLDYELSKIAKKNGVIVFENTKVTHLDADINTIKTDSETFDVKQIIGSFGKRSNLDIDWDRSFVQKNRTTLNQYIGVKYHIKTDFPKDLIALHNFKDGYCGISAIENDMYCLCYMTTKSNLKNHGNDISQMEHEVLKKNPYLKQIFENSKFIWDKPQVISQISFEKKEQVYKGTYLIGDAAGMIAPLCGNGMSMAMHGAYIINNVLNSHQDNYANKYQKEWQKAFSTRLKVGRAIQSLFGNETTTELLVQLMRFSPGLLNQVIKRTHGENIIET